MVKKVYGGYKATPVPLAFHKNTFAIYNVNRVTPQAMTLLTVVGDAFTTFLLSSPLHDVN